MNDDFVAFIHARLDEREQTARAATAGPWTAVRTPNSHPWRIKALFGEVAGPGYEGGGVTREEDAFHIVLNDPAQVLDDIENTRNLVARCEWWLRHAPHGDPGSMELAAQADVILRDVAARWRWDPDYHPDWRPAPMLTRHDRQEQQP